MRALVFAIGLTLYGTAAFASCGLAPLAPLPPLGCSAMVPVCTCDSSGRCWWTFQCVRY